jgi:hypothetical protein
MTKAQIAVKIIGILMIYSCLAMPAFAHLISITPTTPFPSTVNALSITTAVYTVTNLTTKAPLTIIDQSDFPVGLSISASTCHAPIQPKQSCNITLQLNAPAAAQTISTKLKEWASPSDDGVQYPININVVKTNFNSLLVIAGQATTGTYGPPLLYTSTNQGDAWNAITTTTDHVAFSSASCTAGGDSGNAAMCAVSGVDNTTGLPLLYATTDGGSTWHPITSTTDAGQFNAASCAGSSSTAICVAAGQDNTTNLPLLQQSVDGGNTWHLISVNTPDNDEGSFNSVSCTGSGSSTVCVAAGKNTTSALPFLYVTQNGGSTWQAPTLTGIGTGMFNAASCTGNGNTAICIAGGQAVGAQTTLLYVSQNGGSTWQNTEIANANSIFASTSCTGSGNTAICIAAGLGGGTITYPPLYISKNGGSTWQPVGSTPTDIVLLYTANCTGSGSSAICIAGGQDLTSNLPITYITTNGGNTWQTSHMGISDNGVFYTASCTGSGSSAICILGGTDLTTHQPIFLLSTDGTNTWNPVSLGIDVGIFTASGTTGG